MWHVASVIVSMYMSREVVTVTSDTTIKEAVEKMGSSRIRRLVVVDDGRLCGILCHRDVTGSSKTSSTGAPLPRSSPVGMIMKTGIVKIDQNKPIEQAACLMTRYHIGGLPVISNGRLSGIITESDIFRAFTALLSGDEESVRITFDVTDGEGVLPFLYEQCQNLSLELASFVTFKDAERSFAVSQIRGARTAELIDALCDSGHAVVNVLTGDEQ